ncbi:MAG: M48 family metalloprotease [Pseudomonadota bacterium]
MNRLNLFILALTVSILVGCAANPVTGKQDFVLMSEDQEISTGQKYHQEILKQYTPYDDPELQAYVSRLVDDLAQNSHRNHLVYHVTVLDSPEVNAFALPGGYLYITRGIMAYMNTEAELAGVLGHELGHITARHGVRQHSASTIAGILSTAAAIATGSSYAGDATNFASTALVRGYGRGHELEADRLGAEYIAKTGYDPQEMINVVEILKDQEEFDKKVAAAEGREPRGYHGLFSTHPSNDQRLQEVISAANVFHSQKNREEDGTFLKLTNGMVFGTSAREGVIRNNKFYHKELGISITFPQGWQVDNLPTQLIASTNSRDAFMQITVSDLNKRQTPEQYLRERFGNSLKAGEKISTANYEGYTGVAPANTPFGRQDTRIGVVFKGNQVYQFLAAAKDSNLMNRYDRNFIATISSLQALKPSEEKLAQAQHIKLIKAKPGDTFEKYAKTSPLTAYPADQLRLINGLFPNGQPTPGEYVKIIQ